MKRSEIEQRKETPGERDARHELREEQRRDELAKVLAKPDTYEFVVVFTRSIGDDLGCGSKPLLDTNQPIGRALLTQFIEELQQAYDDSGMAGHFQVVSGPTISLGHHNLHMSRYDARLSEPYHPELTNACINFFEVEIRNEKQGGVSPATLGSALDSLDQAPDNIIEEWCSDDTVPGESGDAQEFYNYVKDLADRFGHHRTLESMLNAPDNVHKVGDSIKVYSVDGQDRQIQGTGKIVAIDNDNITVRACGLDSKFNRTTGKIEGFDPESKPFLIQP